MGSQMFIIVYKPCIPLGYENYWPYAREAYWNVYYKHGLYADLVSA